MDPNQPTDNPARRSGHWPLVVLAGGALAWIVVAAVIVAARSGDRDDDRDDAPPGVPIAQQVTMPGTLGARSVTLTAQPTLTPTRTPSLTPSPTSSPVPSLTPTRTASPAPGTAITAAPPIIAPTVPNVPIITLAVSALPPGALPTDAVAPFVLPTAQATAAAPLTSAAAAPGACVPPAGWQVHEVQAGETLFAYVLGAGAESGLTVKALLGANCLSSSFLSVGQVLYLPPGAAENAPASEPYVAADQASGPRVASCPCTITVAEGWRREQIADAVTLSGTSFSGADFLAATGPGVSTSFDVVNTRPAGASMEGYLFPGTYILANDTTAEQFRDMLLGSFVGAVSGQVQADAAAQGVSFHGALTIASIVQRESRGDAQRLVASVIYNRLRDGSSLGATVTVQYVLGRSGAWWPNVTSVNVASPYNTYLVSGLPPGPICNPGLAAITAAVYAPATSYRFHTAACDGSGEVFAETYEQHLANVNCE